MNRAILWITLFLIVINFNFCGAGMKKTNVQKNTVSQVDLNRYMGTWYEIARYPHKFEKDLAGVTATYNLLPDGKITVINQGYSGGLNGKLQRAVGKAKMPDKNQPGKLKVSFFWIFYADYFILELDENYQWAVIGSSSDNYLWILSRTPQMDENLYNQLIEKIKTRGYDLTRLEKVIQPVN